MPPRSRMKVVPPALPDEDVFVFGGEAKPTGHSVPLITFDTATGFAVNQDALALLADVPPPISIVAVAGLYRTGKSFLLNRIILAKQNAFTVGPTTRACTKGIWMWSEPLLVQDSTGRTVRVIVVDTEGIGAPTADATHDTRIFALGLLIATFFIYNSVGSIDEQALSNLSLVTNLSKQIKQSTPVAEAASGQQEKEQEVVVKLPHYPSFLWVVRDFALQLQDQNGKHIGAHEYLEDALKDCDAANPAAGAKNRVRACLRDFFPDRTCFTLVRPCTQENQLQNLDCLPNRALRPEFVQQAGQLRQHVLDQAARRPSTVNGVELSGHMMGLLCKQYVDAINAGQVPVIQDAWSYVCDAQRVKEEEVAISTALAGLNKCVQECVTAAAFNAAAAEVENGVLAAYTSKCTALFGVDFACDDKARALAERVAELVNSFRAQFMMRLSALMSSAVNSSMVDLAAVLADKQVTVTTFKQAVQDKYYKYAAAYIDDDEPKSAEAMWYTSLQPLLWRAFVELGAAQEQLLRAKLEEVEQLQLTQVAVQQEKEHALAEKARELTSLQHLHDVHIQQMEDDMRDLQGSLQTAQGQADAREAEVAQLQGERQALEQEVVREQSRADGLCAELAMLREELQDVEDDARQLQAQTRQLSETSLERDRLREELQAAQAEVRRVKQEFDTAEALYKKETKEVQAKALQSITAMKDARRTEHAQLTAAKEEAMNKCASLESALQASQDDGGKLRRQVADVEQQVVRLRAQVEEAEQRLAQQGKEQTSRVAEMERVQREKERVNEEAVQRLREEKVRLEQQLVIKVQQLETRAVKAEAGEAEKKRQLDLAEERWQRKRARTDDDGDNKSLQLIRAETELTWLRKQQAETDGMLSTLRKEKNELEARVRYLERNQETEVTRIKLEYEHQIALLQQTRY